MTDMKALAAQLPINKLRPFEGHPFRVKDDAEMEQLVTPPPPSPLSSNPEQVLNGRGA